MNFDDYQEAASRTAGQHSAVSESLCNWCMGLAGEAGELVDLVKKSVFHDRPCTDSRLIDEAGDVLWYLSQLCRARGIGLQQVAEANIRKLQARYPGGFKLGGGIRQEGAA